MATSKAQSILNSQVNTRKGSMEISKSMSDVESNNHNKIL